MDCYKRNGIRAVFHGKVKWLLHSRYFWDSITRFCSWLEITPRMAKQ